MRAAEPQNFTGSAAPDRKGISKPPRASHRLSSSSVFISRESWACCLHSCSRAGSRERGQSSVLQLSFQNTVVGGPQPNVGCECPPGGGLLLLSRWCCAASSCPAPHGLPSGLWLLLLLLRRNDSAAEVVPCLTCHSLCSPLPAVLWPLRLCAKAVCCC